MDEAIKNKLEIIVGKLKSDKKSALIILVGIIGMLMIFLSELSGDNKTASAGVQNNQTENSSYETDNEKRLEDLIGNIDGVGKVKVMITYECSSENIFASDSVENQSDDSIKTDTEYIIIDYGENEGGLLIKEVYPKITGIAVVCEGGDNATVIKDITMMLKALFDISSNSISVTKMMN